MSNLRAVNVSKCVYDEASRKYIYVPDGNAVFHMFGNEQDEEGGTFTVAVIEREDGQVQTVVPSLIKFIDPMVVEFVESEVDETIKDTSKPIIGSVANIEQSVMRISNTLSDSAMTVRVAP